MSGKSIMVIAGEMSGDAHAARVLNKVKERLDNIDIFGIGGDEMRKAGVQLHYHARDMAVLGLAEVLIRYRFFRRVFNDMLSLAEERKPDIVLLVDYPGFNLRLAAKLHALGHKVVYYISPQVWAWNRGRIPEMAETIDRLLAIFPFEKKVFEGSGLRVDFVGHPLVEEVEKAVAVPASDLDLPGEFNIALLPGSRLHEVRRILPVMWQAAGLLEKQFPGAGFTIAAASDETGRVAADIIARTENGPEKWKLVTGCTWDILRQSRAAFVTSGTAVLETALLRCPMVIVYKVNWLTYIAGRMVVKISHLGIVNVIAGKTVCPEFIQHTAKPRALADGIAPLIDDGPARSEMIRSYEDVARSLAAAGSTPAHDVIIEELSG